MKKLKLVTSIIGILIIGLLMNIITIISLLAIYMYECTGILTISGADACTYFQTLLTLMWLMVDIATDKSDR